MKLWHERRYYSLDSYLKTTYGESKHPITQHPLCNKVYKISLNAGMTCPNRDGTKGTRGCIFCSAGGSGDFAESCELSITEQIERGKAQTARKCKPAKENGESSAVLQKQLHYIAYFQAYTNTYADLDYLRKIFMEAANHPDILLLSIATRPDCLGEEILDLLSDIQRIKPVWIELGLQTIHEQTASFIRRGYPLSCFDEAVEKLSQRNIPIIVHTILGLPGEKQPHMLETVDYLCRLPLFGLKLQLLHILKGTDLANYYREHPFPLFSEEDYVNLIVEILERIPDTITIHRLTGDGPRDQLIAPQWSLNKRQVLNHIHQRLKELNTWQGRKEQTCNRHFPYTN